MTEWRNVRASETGLESVVERLCAPASYEKVFHRTLHDEPMPSVEVLAECMKRLRAVLFPGYFGNSSVGPESMRYHVGANLSEAHRLLTDQARRGYCFFCGLERGGECQDCDGRARRLADAFLQTLPRLREALAGDAQAAFEGDPRRAAPARRSSATPASPP